MRAKTWPRERSLSRAVGIAPGFIHRRCAEDEQILTGYLVHISIAGTGGISRGNLLIAETSKELVTLRRARKEKDINRPERDCLRIKKSSFT